MAICMMWIKFYSIFSVRNLFVAVVTPATTTSTSAGCSLMPNKYVYWMTKPICAIPYFPQRFFLSPFFTCNQKYYGFFQFPLGKTKCNSTFNIISSMVYLYTIARFLAQLFDFPLRQAHPPHSLGPTQSSPTPYESYYMKSYFTDLYKYKYDTVELHYMNGNNMADRHTTRIFCITLLGLGLDGCRRHRYCRNDMVWQ